MKTALTQAKAQTQATMLLFPCACANAYAATRENEIPLRNNTSIRIFTPPGMFGQWKYWIQITCASRPNSLERSDDFACPYVCVCACAWAAIKARLKKTGTKETKMLKNAQNSRSGSLLQKCPILLQKCPIVTKVPYSYKSALSRVTKVPYDVTKVP